jgi:hypothetical protein
MRSPTLRRDGVGPMCRATASSRSRPSPAAASPGFDEVLDNASYGVTRGSGVLRLTDDGWKIEQYVLSFTIPNDRARAVVEAVKGG